MPSAQLPPEELARLLAPHRGEGGDAPAGPPTDAERWFRAIFERSAAGISLTDASGRFVACNPAFAATIGRAVDEVIGRTPGDFTHPDDWAGQREQFEAARAGGVERYTVAKRYVRPDGSPVWTELSFAAICAAGGKYQYGLGVTVDVTDRKRAEDEARRSAELFRLVWEGSGDGMRLTDADGVVKAVNPAYCQMVGRVAGELIGRPMTAAFATHEQTWVRDKYRRRFAAREVRRMGLAEVTLWDGRRRWFEVGDAYVDLPGEPPLMLTVFRDATDRQRAEDALRESGNRRRRQQMALLELLRDDRRTGEAGVRRVLEVVANTLLVERVSLWHLTPQQDAIRCAGLYERAADRHSAGLVLSAADYPAYFAALRSEEVIAAADAAADPRTCEFRDGYLKPLGITGMLDVPLRVNGRMGGVLCLEHTGPVRAWAVDEQVFALAAASLLSLAAEQAERQRAEAGLRASEGRFRSAFDFAPIGMALVAPDGRWLKVNRAVCDILGYAEDELLAIDFQTLTHPDDLTADLALVGQLLAGERSSYQMEKRYFHKTGAVVYTSLAVSLVRDEDGRPLYFISHIQDISARRRAEDALRESEEQFRAAMEGSLDAVFFLAAERDAAGTIADFRFTDLNSRGARLVSREREDVLGRRLCELLPVNRTGGFFDKYVRVVETGEPLEEEFPIVADGLAAGWLHHQVVKVGDGVVVTSRDVTDRKRAEIGLRASEEQLRTLGDNLPDGVVFQYVVGPDGRDHFPYMSRGIERLTGLAPARVQADARLVFGLIHPDDLPAVTAAIGRSMGELSEFDLEARYSHLNGNLRWMHIRSAPRRLPDGGTAWDGVMVDVTDRKRAEDEVRQNERRLIESQRELERVNARLRELAATDGLTGVGNRATFDAKLSEEFDRAVRYGHPLSVLMLDVDHFKQFNDTFGHPAGDAVLRTVADKLGDAVRGSDIVARYGGEEFAVLLPDTDHAGAVAVAERCRRAVADAGWDRRAITVSVGAATLTPTTADADALVQEADQALYRSKQAGRNRVNHGSDPIPHTAACRAG